MSGYVAGVATVDNGVLITVPAGGTFQGSLALTGSLAAGALSGALNAGPSVEIHGANAEPANGSVLAKLALATPVIGLLALLGVTSGTSIVIPNINVTAPAGNSVDLKLHYNSATVAAATINGYLY